MAEWLDEAQEELGLKLKEELGEVMYHAEGLAPRKNMDVKDAVMQDNEVFLALLGRRFAGWWYGVGHWANEGHPARVHFDPLLVEKREDERGDVVGFFHTHPNMVSRPSGIDYATMSGWTVSFGRPMACLIEGKDGLKGHWFLDDEHYHLTTYVVRYGNVFIGKCPSKKDFKKKANS